MPKTLVYLACGAMAVGPAVGAFAATDTSVAGGAAGASTATPRNAPASHPAGPTTPAPPGHAEAAALLIDGLIGVGHTTADAGPDSSSATANAVEVGGKPLIDGTTGGSRTGNGSGNGALLDTGTTPLGQLQLTPWQASASSANGSSSSDADAALARAILVDPTVANASILQSSSHARYTSTGSTGNASSDGAVVDAGNGALTADLLHAESSSSGSGGTSYLASVNGNQIGTSDQANGGCTLTVPQVLSLSCLTASGGPASTTASSAVGTATIADGQAPGAQLVAGKSSGAKVDTGTTGQSPDATQVKGEKFRSPSSASSSSSLPFTGGDAAPMAALAALAVAAGAWVQQVAGRRRRDVRA
jgi:hypothetical protein